MSGRLRVLELYSGIGGMHFALQKAGILFEVVASVDINPAAKYVYKANFSSTTYWEKNIEGLKAADLDKLNINLLMMSPPCQPFTRIGLQKDVHDPRTRSFLHLLEVFEQMTKPPDYILLENVKGFESSKTHEIMCKTFKTLQYSWQGFLVSPKHLGIPNSRLRYFFLAKRKPKSRNQPWHSEEKILDYLPNVHKTCGDSDSLDNLVPIPATTGTVGSYLEQSEVISKLRLPPNVVKRYLSVMDVVSKDSQGSTCFTKSYGKYIEGTGSIFNMATDNEEMDLRYFSPREIANLMGFPNEFHFPETVTNNQKYKLLGNSLNVEVVSHLLSVLLR